MQTKKNEIWVGVFLLVALLAALFVCLKAANVTSLRTEPTYRLYATFDNIGGLKARSPVRIGGVVVGRVADITLDPKTYLPRVELDIDERYNHIPDTSSLAIRTSGLDREEVFIETKIWVSDYGYDNTLHAFDKASGKLGVDQIDLLFTDVCLGGISG